MKWWALFLLGCHATTPTAPEEAVKVHCAPVETRPWSELRSLRGTVAAAPDRDAVVSPQVSGRLLRVLVREGDAVERNAVVAEVEAPPLVGVVRQAEASLAQATAMQKASALAVTREEHLFERGISARQSLEQARAALGQSDGAVASATAQVDVARQNLGRAEVRAPMRGVVVRLMKRVGEVVDGTPATPVMEIADPSSLELVASAAPADLMALSPKQTAVISYDALPGRTFTGVVRSTSPSVDATTGVGTVRITLRSDGKMPPIGLLGTAVITVGAARTVAVVPSSAVRNVGGTQNEVVACRAGKAVPIAVTVGERRDGAVEVHGVDAGTRVATDELVGLEAGTSIEVQP